MKRILVTGGSGFIGTNLIQSLIEHNNDILNIDIAEPSNKDHLQYWKKINILNYNELENEFLSFDPEVVIHLAVVTDLNGNSMEYYSANVLGTENIIRIASKLISLKKILFTSSMYVCQPGFIPQDYDTYKPHTIYGESKMRGEMLVKQVKNTKYDWAIIRPTSIWGPWFDVPYIDFFKIVYEGKYFDFGKACTKTYGYVGNTVYQILRLIDSDKIHGKTFYLGDNPPIQISEWANEISIAMRKESIKTIPLFLLKSAAIIGDVLSKLKIKFPITTFRLNNMTTNNVLPLENLLNTVGESPFTRAEGIKETIEWLVVHKNIK